MWSEKDFYKFRAWNVVNEIIRSKMKMFRNSLISSSSFWKGLQSIIKISKTKWNNNVKNLKFLTDDFIILEDGLNSKINYKD